MFSAANEADSRPGGLLSPEAARRLSLLPPVATLPAMSMGDAALGGCCTVSCCGIGWGEGLLVAASGDASGARGSPADGLQPRSEATVDVSDVVLLGGKGRILDLTYQGSGSTFYPSRDICFPTGRLLQVVMSRLSALAQARKPVTRRPCTSFAAGKHTERHLAKARPG